jgi:hypothetical protein
MNHPSTTTTQAQTQTRLVGVVQLRVGGQLYAVPVQALDFASAVADTQGPARGGFYVQGDQMGILVDQAADEQQMRSQVMEGCAEAVRHLSAKFLN